MFIRWKKRETRVAWRKFKYEKIEGKWIRTRKPENEIPCLLSAYLVQSVRIDGKPRQKATFLASIQREKIDSHHYRRLRFWQTVQKRIEQFNLPQDEVVRVKEKLLVYVPDVTKEQIQAANQEFSEAETRLKKLMGHES